MYLKESQSQHEEEDELEESPLQRGVLGFGPRTPVLTEIDEKPGQVEQHRDHESDEHKPDVVLVKVA